MNTEPEMSKKRSIDIVMSADENYAPYLSVCIESLKSVAAPDRTYSLNILDGGISAESKKKLINQHNENLSIQFIDMNPYFSKYDSKIFALPFHFTIATYYRFFLPLIFSSLDKIIYIDCDTIINKDPSELINIDLTNKYFAATKDMYVTTVGDKDINKELNSYLYDVLKLKNHYNYFQAGLMIWNLEFSRKNNFTEKCIDQLIKIKSPKYADQCILNSLCEEKIIYINEKWNYTWHLNFLSPEIIKKVVSLFPNFYEIQKDPFIIHFASSKKPWHQSELDGADYFWKHTLKCPFYDQILVNNKIFINSRKSLSSFKFKYYFYSFLTFVFHGQLKAKFKSKKIKYS